jgi:hypothetical protein
MLKLAKKELINLSLNDKEIDKSMTDEIAGGSATWFCSVAFCETSGCCTSGCGGNEEVLS